MNKIHMKLGYLTIIIILGIYVKSKSVTHQLSVTGGVSMKNQAHSKQVLERVSKHQRRALTIINLQD